MARISKSLAESVALKMTLALDTKRESIGVKITNLLLEAHLRTIPREIIRGFELTPAWFHSTTSLYGGHGGLNEYERFSIPRTPTTKDGNDRVELTREEYEVFIGLRAERATLRSKGNKLCAQIEGTLLSLGSPKKIKEQFPAAVPFLPEDFFDPEGSRVPAVQTEELLREIESLKNL